MNKTIIQVPKGIRYLSDWPEFSLPDHPCILDKQITGCGFTEWVIRNSIPEVLISPRKKLLENKAEQHPGEIYYAENIRQEDLGVDKNLQNTKAKVIDGISVTIEGADKETYFYNLQQAMFMFDKQNKVPKLEVTYDSFRLVKDFLEKIGRLDQFSFVVDEFQSIFTDSRFKPDTEIELLHELQGLQRVSFVSATPMIEEYLDLLDEFKDLPYYELDWKTLEPERIKVPNVIARGCRNINEVIKKYITDFKAGKFAKKTIFNEYGQPVEVREARQEIFYVNSVKNIGDAIRQNQLIPEEVNIICSDTAENRTKIREAFRVSFKAQDRPTKQLPKLSEVIGNIPTSKDKNKPLTFCTKTAYLGADFYSDCARTIVLSDSGIECLAVDITLDLPQILGRQRLDENPWKHDAEVWFKFGVGVGEVTKEEFDSIIQEKLRKTESLLISYSTSPTAITKHDLADKFLSELRYGCYKKDYVAVNKHAGSDLLPITNNLVMIAERRAFDIQQVDYKDRFSVINTIEKVLGSDQESSSLVGEFMDKFNSFLTFREKMKFVVEYLKEFPDNTIVFQSISPDYQTFYTILGPDFIKSVSYQRSKLSRALENTTSKEKIYTKEDLQSGIYEIFKEGDRVTRNDLKDALDKLYIGLGFSMKAKASDIEEWFETRPCKITNQQTGKRDHSFELVKKKH